MRNVVSTPAPTPGFAQPGSPASITVPNSPNEDQPSTSPPATRALLPWMAIASVLSLIHI